jgi:hypothetical protein
LEGLAVEEIGIFMAILSILQPKGGHLVYISRFGMLYRENLATLLS